MIFLLVIINLCSSKQLPKNVLIRNNFLKRLNLAATTVTNKRNMLKYMDKMLANNIKVSDLCKIRECPNPSHQAMISTIL